MSEANIEIVRGLWDSIKAVDGATVDWDSEPIRDLFEAPFAPDVELRWAAGGPDLTVYRGSEGVIRAFKEWVEPFTEYYAEALDYIAHKDRVIVPTRQRGIGKTSGAPVEIEVTHNYYFRDGRINRVDEYETVEAALRAAGFSE